MVKKIKQILLDDISKLEHILEDLGCGDIKNHHGEIRCSLPESDNNTSVQIFTNEFFNVNIWSREEFNNYEIRDIVTLVQYIRRADFPKATAYLCSKLGIENNTTVDVAIRSPVIKNLNLFKPKKSKSNTHDYLPDEYLEQFEKYVVEEWVNEGISAETQAEFEVFIDRERCRWKFPIRDECGKIVTTKGRTYLKNYDELGVYKYIYHPPMGTNDILFNIYKALPFVKEKDEIILFEAEKSVKKMWSANIKNCSSIGKNSINPHLLKKIIALPCSNVVLALDKDVKLDAIKKEVEKLKRYKNVYYIYDTEDLLWDKDAPIDMGIDMWDKLYESRVRG
jgi:DNA primase